jgi:hypothetical protein
MKTGNYLCWLIALCLITLPGIASSQEEELTETLGHGQVNWTSNTIRATGSGAPNLKAPNVAAARLGAERVAKLDALRNILETLKGVRVKSEVTVENEMMTSSKMRSKIEGVARRFKVVSTKYYSDGGVDIVVEMPIGKVASALLDVGAKKKGIPLKGDVKNTGLVIDARGAKVLPSMAPRLVDEDSKVIYSSEFLEENALEKLGVVGYFKDMEAAKKSKRIGKEPLLLKAMKLDKSSTDVRLSNADARLLRDPNANLSYLTEGRVIIVVD